MKKYILGFVSILLLILQWWMFSSLITEVAGASKVFQAGYVVYQKEEKISCLWGFQKNIS